MWSAGSAGDCKPTPDGRHYIGHMSVTESGKQCQAWTSQSPHEHSFNQDNTFPDSSITDASNYCRNPDMNYDEGVWCYTMDPNTRWERCNVPICGQSVYFIKQNVIFTHQYTLISISVFYKIYYWLWKMSLAHLITK